MKQKNYKKHDLCVISIENQFLVRFSLDPALYYATPRHNPLRKICSRKTLRRTRVKQGHRRLWHGGGLIWFMVFQRQMHTCSHKGCLRGLCPVRIWKIWYYLKQESCNLVNSFRRKLSAAMSKNNGYFFPWLNVLFC